MGELITAIVFASLMVAAGTSDARTLRIPNWLCLSIAALFFPAALIFGFPAQTIGWHALTGFGVLAVTIGLYAAGLIGGGDAKLFAAAAMWFGWSDLTRFSVYVVMAGGILALGIAALCLWRADHDVRGLKRLKMLRELKPNVPYGVAMAAGALLTLPGSWLADGFMAFAA